MQESPTYNESQRGGYSSTSRDQTIVQSGVSTWLGPISNSDFSPGATWSIGPDAPIGDPPIQLRSLSVSEGTL